MVEKIILKFEKWLIDKLYDADEEAVKVDAESLSVKNRTLSFCVFLFKAGFIYFIIDINFAYAEAIWQAVARAL